MTLVSLLLHVPTLLQDDIFRINRVHTVAGILQSANSYIQYFLKNNN